jgi:microcystin-dependent protein
MARNGSGTMTVVNTLVPGEVITASDHNENYSDIAAEITNSVAVDGQSTLTGPLKATSGTVAAPGITFGSDTDSGLYRIGANNIGVAVNGAKVIDVATTGATITGDMNATTVKQNGLALLPIGLGPLPWCRLSAPAGWVLCYGQSLSRTTYAALWAVAEAEIALGNPLFTVGDGSTTFTILDMRGYVAAGQDDMGGSSANRLTGVSGSVNGDTFGAAGGSETKTIDQAHLPNVSLSSASLAALSSVTNGGNVHVGNTPGGAAAPGGTTFYRSADIAVVTVTVGTTISGTVPLGGSGTAIPVMQPTIILNQIIYAGV